jgi:hypothetical protein
MIVFDPPFSRFTAIDLLTLSGMWPETRHRNGPEADSLLVVEPDRRPWLSINRLRDGRYQAIDLAGHIFAEGRTLADLALEGPD